MLGKAFLLKTAAARNKVDETNETEPKQEISQAKTILWKTLKCSVLKLFCYYVWHIQRETD